MRKIILIIFIALIIGSCGENNYSKSSNVDQIENEKIDGELIGKWIENQKMNLKYIFFKKNDKYYMKSIYNDNSSNIEELKLLKNANGQKLTHLNKGDYSGEYYIILNNGELGFFNSENIMFAKGTKTN